MSVAARMDFVLRVRQRPLGLNAVALFGIVAIEYTKTDLKALSAVLGRGSNGNVVIRSVGGTFHPIRRWGGQFIKNGGEFHEKQMGSWLGGTLLGRLLYRGCRLPPLASAFLSGWLISRRPKYEWFLISIDKSLQNLYSLNKFNYCLYRPHRKTRLK